ncbi:MAG TPA: FkbM family methyltransferase [Propylenella sp.]
MRRQRCALVMLPGDGFAPERLSESLMTAEFVGLGDFGEVVPLRVAEHSVRSALAAAARKAVEEGFDWLLAVGPAETLAPDIFVKVAPALRLHDAIWGGASLAETGRLERITRLAAQDLPQLFHAALAWWIGPSHFVRPAAALPPLHGPETSGWYGDYLVSLWRSCRPYKTAQGLTVFRDIVPPLADEDRVRLVDHLEREPVFMSIRVADRTLRVPYTGLNPVIERDQMRGLFFEHEELQFLADRLPRGLRILDVGANTGNHTLFFATIMEAEIVIPIEPHPRSADAIRTVVDANALTNVDLSLLGQAAGDHDGALRAVPSGTAGLGAMRFVVDPAGTVPVAPLDKLVQGRIDFVKIDVEGMEMEVLAGAQSLMASCRPALYIEVVDETIPDFMAWIDVNTYRIEKLFPDKTHCNYLLLPAEGS